MTDKQDSAQKEEQRLLALHRYNLLDTPPEAVFDDITRIASEVCGTPIALISIVDESRQWFKSKVGLDAAETPRDIAFCDHAIRGDLLFEVTDAAEDFRFKDNPLVTGDPNIRFYSGMPLTTDDGFNLGTLCVIDRKPRELTTAQKQCLSALARQLVLQLELRRSLADEQRTREELHSQYDERTRLEAAERSSKQFLRGIQDALRDHIAIVNSKGVIVDANRAWRDFADENLGDTTLAGLDVGANYLEVCERAATQGAQEAAEVALALKRILLLNTDEEFSLEYACHAPDQQRWFIVRISLLQNGKEHFAVVSHQNITKRKLAENSIAALNDTLEKRVEVRNRELVQAFNALRESESKFRTMFDGAAVGLAMISPDSTLEDCNAAFDSIIGVERHGYIGQSMLDLIYAEDIPDLDVMREEFLNDATTSVVHDNRLRRADGSDVWVNSSIVAIRDAEGKFSRSLLIVQNISERKTAEYERDQFFEQSADMFAIVGFDGTITRVNKAANKVLDYEPEMLLNTRYIDLIVDEEQAAFKDVYQSLIDGDIKSAAYLDITMHLKSGGTRVVRWTIALWREAEKMLAVGRDMTDTFKTENSLKALTARLHQIREDERSRISREIHDHLGQMLTALKMDLSLLQRDVTAMGADGDSLTSDINGMLELVDSTLNAVRRIAQELRPEILDALGLVAAIEWQMQEFQERSGISCKFSAAKNTPPITDTQTTELFRIVQEAMTNIARHADASHAVVALYAEGDKFFLTIADDGKGFEVTDSKHLSLGLLGMRERAAAIGATFELDATPGKGTTITLVLKISDEVAQ